LSCAHVKMDIRIKQRKGSLNFMVKISKTN
jgi:hypothetical protein